MTGGGPLMKMPTAVVAKRAHRELALGADVPDSDPKRHRDREAGRISGVTSRPKSSSPKREPKVERITCAPSASGSAP